MLLITPHRRDYWNSLFSAQELKVASSVPAEGASRAFVNAFSWGGMVRENVGLREAWARLGTVTPRPSSIDAIHRIRYLVSGPQLLRQVWLGEAFQGLSFSSAPSSYPKSDTPEWEKKQSRPDPLPTRSENAHTASNVLAPSKAFAFTITFRPPLPSCTPPRQRSSTERPL